HGRSAGGGIVHAQAAIGCLFVQSSKGMPGEALHTALLDAVRDQKLEYGLRIAAVSSMSGLRGGGRGRGPGGFAPGGGGGPGGGAAGSSVGDPIAIFKVYPDGREERVRGCEFGSIEVAALKNILAAGQE